MTLPLPVGYTPNPSEVSQAILFLKRVNETPSRSFPLEDKFAPILAYLLSYRGQAHGEQAQLMAGKLLCNQVRMLLSLILF